jgi:hypothetical protein
MFGVHITWRHKFDSIQQGATNQKAVSTVDCHASAQMEANSSLKICLLKTLCHISFFDVGRQAESLLKRSRVHGSTPLVNIQSR